MWYQAYSGYCQRIGRNVSKREEARNTTRRPIPAVLTSWCIRKVIKSAVKKSFLDLAAISHIKWKKAVASWHNSFVSKKFCQEGATAL